MRPVLKSRAMIWRIHLRFPDVSLVPKRPCKLSLIRASVKLAVTATRAKDKDLLIQKKFIYQLLKLSVPNNVTS